MPLAEALSLLNRNDLPNQPQPTAGRANEPHMEPHQPDVDQDALRQLAAWCEQFSPLVGLESHAEPQSLLFDVTGLGPLFGGEEALAWRVIEAFGRRGYSIRVAIADTVGAAWALSRYGADPRSMRNSETPWSEGAQDRRPTMGGRTIWAAAPRIVPPGRQRETLKPLAVEALRLPAPTLTALHQLGLFQIGQVLELPRAGLASRFQHEGKCALLERLDQTMGNVEELITPHRPPPEFRAERCLEPPATRLVEVRMVLAELFDQVCRELAARSQGALRSVCRLDCERGEVRKIELGLFQPTVSARRLLELAAMQLERTQLPSGVGRIGVEAPLTAPLTARQYALFVEEGRRRPRELALLIDRLSSRLGPERVVRPRLLPDAQPERAFCEESLVGRPLGMNNEPTRERSPHRGMLRTPKEKQRSKTFPSSSSTRSPSLRAFQRPLRLWSPPVAIEVMAVAHGPPISFRMGRRRFRVHRWWGPERIETGWWRGRSVRRDYYQVETTTGARYWLFRHLIAQQWFLHGEYG